MVAITTTNKITVNNFTMEDNFIFTSVVFCSPGEEIDGVILFYRSVKSEDYSDSY